MGEEKNKLNDDIERKVEIILAVIGVMTGIGAIYLEKLSDPWAVGLIALSFALYQGTSLAKILKKIK